MRRILLIMLSLILGFSFSGTNLTITDSNGNPIDWIEFKLHPYDEYTEKVDTVWVNPLDYGKTELYSAANAAYPNETIIELGGITMNGYDTEEGIFDYFGPFTAKVYNPNVHRGDKVALFVYGEAGVVEKIKAFNVKEGAFSFRASSAAYCVYVILG